MSLAKHVWRGVGALVWCGPFVIVTGYGWLDWQFYWVVSGVIIAQAIEAEVTLATANHRKFTLWGLRNE